MTPTVSVVVPTLNRPTIVLGAIASVLSQTFEDFELIVVVDGPDDATERALRSLHDDRLRIIVHQTNHGCSTARNTGIAAATGTWIALLDDDDLWRPEKLERQLAIAEAVDARWVMCDSVNFEATTGEVVGQTKLGDLADLTTRFVGGNPLHAGPSAALIYRSVLDAVGAFDTSLLANEDFDLWVRLAAGTPCVNVEEPLVAYRVAGTSLSTDIEVMKSAGRDLAIRIGDDQVQAGGSRYLARQALQGGDRFGAGKEFLRCARDHRSVPDLARATASALAPGSFLAYSRKRTAEEVDPMTRSVFNHWIAESTAAERRADVESGESGEVRRRAVIRSTASMPIVGARLITRLLDGRHGWRLQTPTPRFVDDVATALSWRPEVISVDVFETLLARRLINQGDIEMAVGNRLVAEGLWPSSPAAYRAARREAAQAVVEGGLVDWYNQPALSPTTDPAAAIAAELAVETELTYVLPGVREGLEAIRRSPARLVLLSDMYLSGEEVRELLAHHGLIDDDDHLIVSSDERTSKQAGPLYGLAHGDAVGRGAAVHIGNNSFIDGAMAAANGVDPLYTNRGNPTRYELLVAGATTAPGGSSTASVGSIVAGAARKARLDSAGLDSAGLDSTDDHRLGAIEVHGTQVLGPMVTSFLLWIRETLNATGHRHIAFLARDGELPYLMAQAMPSDYWKGFGLEYLHSSRATWSLASASTSAIGVDEWIEVGTADDSAFLNQLATTVPFSSLLKRAGLDLDDVPRSSPLFGRPGTSALGQGELVHWLSLLADPEVRDLIERRSTVRRDEIVDHLRQTGLPTEPIALVDVGWRGQAAWFVSALIREATGHEPIHLHFGGDGVVASIDQRIDIRRFALDDSRRPHPIDSPVSCVEMFLAAGQARLVGYDRLPDGTVEKLFAPPSAAIDTPTVRALWAGAMAVAREMPPMHSVVDWLGEPAGPDPDLLVEEIRALLAALWNTPTADDVAKLAGLRFEHDSSGDSVGRVVRPYRLKELVGRDRLARQWRAGSLVASSPLNRCVFTMADAVRRRYQGRPHVSQTKGSMPVSLSRQIEATGGPSPISR